MVEEYLVKDCKKVADFSDKQIGIHYDITYNDISMKDGSITFFDIEYEDHQKIREYISKMGLWSNE